MVTYVSPSSGTATGIVREESGECTSCCTGEETAFLLVCNFDPLLLRELGTTKELLARNAREEGEEN